MSCKTMSIDLANVPPVPIQIGVAGENSFRTITFDASKWGADYPDATYTVVYRRSDGYLYPVLVNASADAIVWSPTETDTAVSGNGQLEVRLLDGETIGKTIIMQTYVAPSLSGDESEPSTPAPDWVNDVAADADRAEAAVSHYPKIVGGYWYVWSVSDEDFVSTGISAQGEDGYSPTVTVTEIEGGHRVTITDADGAHTFDVMDGDDGSGAVQSVNGKTGAVVLDASDVGALPDDTVIPSQIGQLSDNVGLVHYNSQTLTDAQKAQARTNIGAASMSDIPSLAAYRTASAQDAIDAAQDAAIAAKYTKPSGGIPKTDLAAGVIPTVPQMATEDDMSDWTMGKTVDALTLKAYFRGAIQSLDAISIDIGQIQSDLLEKADKTEIPTKVSDLTNDSNYQTASDVQTAIAGIPDELPTVTASDNGKFLRVVSGAWAAETVPAAEGSAF